MTTRSVFPFGAVVFATLFTPSLCTAQCFDRAPGDGPAQLIPIVDSTGSIPQNQSAWLGMVHPLSMCIRPGDKVRVLKINANSGQTAPVVDLNLSFAPPGAPLVIRVEVHNQVLHARQQTEAALNASLSGSRDAQSTDILSIFERIHSVPGMKTLVVIFSDGLEVSKKDHLNLETTPVTAKLIQTILPGLAQRHGWTPTTLAGVRIYFVLPTTDGRRETTQVNDPQSLALFYRSLITAMGGSLASFSVDLPGIQSQMTGQPLEARKIF